MPAENMQKTTGTHQSGITEDALLKVAKEITVKFIEMGRITPATFDACFADIYQSIQKTVRRN